MNWKDIIRSNSVNLIVGQKGKGKSGLGYFLLHDLAGRHGLVPVVVNFPKSKRGLLPGGYRVMSLADALLVENAFILVDEGTTQLPAGGVLEEFIKGASSLSRQRNQIMVFIFHASRDVGSRIMRGVDTIMVKETTQRQIDQGSKDKHFSALLEEAKAAIRGKRGERRRWTYVDCVEPEFRGLMPNALPPFWSEDLSNAWRGVSLTGGAGEEESPEAYLDRMRLESDVRTGEGLVCTMCGRTAGRLRAEVCEECFVFWMLSARRGHDGH